MKMLWLGLVMVLIGCSDTGREEKLLPDRIQGMALTRSRTGGEASEMIRRLHAKSVAPVASAIGEYGTGRPPLTLYVSRFASVEDAGNQLDLMAGTIGPGRSGFVQHRVDRVEDMDAHYVFGHGQGHYFYADEDRVVWLSAPVDVVRPALAELLTRNR